MGDKDRMQPKEVATMPVFVHEYEMFRMERINKRLCVAIAAITGVFATILLLKKR